MIGYKHGRDDHVTGIQLQYVGNPAVTHQTESIYISKMPDLC